MAKYRVIVTDNRHGDYTIESEVLAECDAEVIVEDCTSEDELIRLCSKADGLMLDQAPMTARVIKALQKVRVISRYGVGYDNLDLRACTEKGIYAANVPDYCEEDVSDMAIAHIFCSLRQLNLRDKRVRRGEWNLGRENIYRLKGKVLSIIGYGRSGSHLHAKMSAMGLGRVLVYDPYVDRGIIEAAGGRPVSFEEAVREADILSLHVPLTEETSNMIDGRVFARMKKTAILINTSRGGIVHHGALVAALQEKRIAFAGLDTHHIEPLPADDPLLEIENCVLSDHAGFNTQEAVAELKTKVSQNVKDVLTGGVPRYWLNKF